MHPDANLQDLQSLEWSRLPEPVRTVAVHCVLDWLGCALAGSTMEPVSQLCAEFERAAGASSLIGRDGSVAATAAALINGTAGHVLDFDDTSVKMRGHPTAPVLPAVLAQAQELHAEGAKLLTALVIGAEVEAHYGRLLGPEPYNNGWHVTSLIGVLGAAVSVAYLLGLKETQVGHAIGIAASQASGVKANFGTMTKSLQVGQAAERGLLAARLAARGVTANIQALDGPQGLVGAVGGNSCAPSEKQSTWAIRDTLFKYHAACHLTHSTIECVHTLRAALEGKARHIRIAVHPTVLTVCNNSFPRTGLELKFSLGATAAMAWLGLNTQDPDQFTGALAGREDLQAFLSKAEVVVDEQLPLTAAVVEVETDAGQQHRETRDVGQPETDLAYQFERVREKFRMLAAKCKGIDERAVEHEVSVLAESPDVTGLVTAVSTG